MIDACIDAVEDGDLENQEALLERIRTVAEGKGVKSRDAFRVLYVAILGQPAGLPKLATPIVGTLPPERRPNPSPDRRP